MCATNLIVNYLPPDADEDEIKSLFAEHGDVESVKLVRNKETGTSMCYGFVVMQDPSQAELCIKEINQKSLRGKILRVSRAKPRASQNTKEGPCNNNLYISCLPATADEALLEKNFGRIGVLISCRVLRNPNGTSRGIAFVRFVEPSDAQRAVNELDGKPLCDAQCREGECTCTGPGAISIKFALPNGKNVQSGRRQSSSSLSACYPSPYQSPSAASSGAYMGVYPNHAYGYQAGGSQQAYCYATHSTSQYPPASGAYGGYYSSGMAVNGYAAYPYQSTANHYNSLVGGVGQSLCGSYSGYPAVSQQSTAGSVTASNLAQISSGNHCVFVYGLGQGTTEQGLHALFYPYGAISNCRVCYETSSGKRVSKGYGFVNFYSYNDAQQAISALNNFLYNGHTLQVRFKTVKEGT